MATIFDLFEVTDISENTTYSKAAGNLLGVVDNVSSAALDDGEFDAGDDILIGGVPYNIDLIQEPSSSGRFTLGNGTDRSFDPGSESNLSVVFLTVSNGADVRYFIIPNDSYGDMNVQAIRTGSLNNVAGSDAAIISTADNNINVVCFAEGTMITTPGGDVAVEAIRVGDLALTRDNGPQPVRAILVQPLDFNAAPARLKPIRFAVDSLGPGRPNRPLFVSPQHRMLVRDMSGTQVLVPAKALTPRPGVRVARGKGQVTYIHLVFSRHEIIYANGTMTESFFPGTMALGAVPERCRAEIENIFYATPASNSDGREIAAAPLLRVQYAKRHASDFT